MHRHHETLTVVAITALILLAVAFQIHETEVSRFRNYKADIQCCGNGEEFNLDMQNYTRVLSETHDVLAIVTIEQTTSPGDTAVAELFIQNRTSTTRISQVLTRRDSLASGNEEYERALNVIVPANNTLRIQATGESTVGGLPTTNITGVMYINHPAQ